MSDERINELNILTDIEVLIRKGKVKLALQRIADLRKEIGNHE